MLQPFDFSHPEYWEALQKELRRALRGFLPGSSRSLEEVQAQFPDLSARFWEALSKRPPRKRKEEPGRPDFNTLCSGLPPVAGEVCLEAPRSVRSEGEAGAAFKRAARLRWEREELERKIAQELSRSDESFSQMVLRKMYDLGLSSVECYRRANVDRKLFSKLKSDPQYRPSKETALAFAIALELDPEETEELLKKAGFALSKSKPFDIIVNFFIKKGEFDIHLINEALYHYDQPLLGGS